MRFSKETMKPGDRWKTIMKQKTSVKPASHLDKQHSVANAVYFLIIDQNSMLWTPGFSLSGEALMGLCSWGMRTHNH
jgi:hypothetical protein